MRVTEVTLTLSPSDVEERDGIIAFARVVIGSNLAISDIKVMRRGTRIMLGMPSRKKTDHCPQCRSKNALVDRFCGYCGSPRDRKPISSRGLYSDIVFPVNREFRRILEEAIVEQFNVQVRPEKRLTLD